MAQAVGTAGRDGEEFDEDREGSGATHEDAAHRRGDWAEGGKVLGRYKVGKHFDCRIGEGSFTWSRRQDFIDFATLNWPLLIV